MEQRTTHTYEYGNISIVVHRPALDETERRKREAALQRAVIAYGKATLTKGVDADASHG